MSTYVARQPALCSCLTCCSRVTVPLLGAGKVRGFILERACRWMCVVCFGHCARLSHGPGLPTRMLHSDLQHVELTKVVGHGSCGVVFRGTYGSRPVAVKLIELAAEVRAVAAV